VGDGDVLVENGCLTINERQTWIFLPQTWKIAKSSSRSYRSVLLVARSPYSDQQRLRLVEDGRFRLGLSVIDG
jgi:hypothetical protein